MFRIIRWAWLFAMLISSAEGDDSAPAPLRLSGVRIDAGMNSLFENREGWIGSDAVYSIPLADESTLWVFGDTLVGKVRDGRRHDVVMVNNSFARQRGWGASAKVELYLNRDRRGKPASYVVPDGKPGYFWLWDGIVVGDSLHIFTTRLTSPGTITAFDWKLMDQSLVSIDNPLDDPSRWRVRQRDFPFGVFSEEYEAIWGMEVVQVDGELYLYGTIRQKASDPRGLVVARVAPEELLDFSQWRFYSDGRWLADAKQASPLATHVGTEGSVTWLPEQNRYVYVYSPPLDPRIQMRTARSPVGPWSKPVTIYTCPEATKNERVFCYAAKARLIPGTADKLLISYATNSFDMLADVTADATIYMPRFVQGTIEP